MSVDTKKHIYTFIESLKVTNRGILYNMIKAHVEENKEDFKDPFTDDKKVVRIHKGNQEECENCSA